MGDPVMMSRNIQALAAYLAERENWTFGYGAAARTQDCARWVCGAAKAATGRDPLAGFDGRWTTELGAARVMRRHGGMAGAVGSVLPEIWPPQAKRGDIGVSEAGFLVLFWDDGVIGLDEPSGYVRLPRANAVRAWSIG